MRCGMSQIPCYPHGLHFSLTFPTRLVKILLFPLHDALRRVAWVRESEPKSGGKPGRASICHAVRQTTQTGSQNAEPPPSVSHRGRGFLAARLYCVAPHVLESLSPCYFVIVQCTHSRTDKFRAIHHLRDHQMDPFLQPARPRLSRVYRGDSCITRRNIRRRNYLCRRPKISH